MLTPRASPEKAIYNTLCVAYERCQPGIYRPYKRWMYSTVYHRSIILLLTFKAIHDQVPGYMASLLQQHNICPGLWSSGLILQVHSTCSSCNSNSLPHYLTTWLSCWSDISSLNRLQAVQNESAWLLMRKKKFDRITPILTEFHWLPVRKRIQFKILLLTFKALHNQSPGYISSLIEECKLRPGLRTSGLSLCVPSTHLKTYRDWPCFLGSCSAPLELPTCHSSQYRWPWTF